MTASCTPHANNTAALSRQQTSPMASVDMEENAPAVYIPVDSGEVISILHSELPEEVEDMIEILAAETAALHVWVQVAKAYLAQVRSPFLVPSRACAAACPDASQFAEPALQLPHVAQDNPPTCRHMMAQSTLHSMTRVRHGYSCSSWHVTRALFQACHAACAGQVQARLEDHDRREQQRRS